MLCKCTDKSLIMFSPLDSLWLILKRVFPKSKMLLEFLPWMQLTHKGEMHPEEKTGTLCLLVILRFTHQILPFRCIAIDRQIDINKIVITQKQRPFFPYKDPTLSARRRTHLFYPLPVP